MYKGQSIQHKVIKEELFFVVSGNFFSTLIALTLSPQPITSHHFAIHINISHKLAFFFPSLLCTTLHFSSYHFTTLLDAFHFTTLLDDFHLILLRCFSKIKDNIFKSALYSFFPYCVLDFKFRRLSCSASSLAKSCVNIPHVVCVVSRSLT
jgi:hypothetical protein